MVKIQPAPILIESSEMKTSEIIDLMISKKTSYVLLTDEKNEISGIFTNNDLLRLFRTISQEASLNLPILNYMVKPVLTLPLYEIHRAPKLMVDHNIRHVPIIHERNVVGIVTEDSVFKSVIANMSRNILTVTSLYSFEEQKNIGVISPDGDLFSLFKNIFENESQVNIRRIWYNDLQSKSAARNLGKSYNALVMDIDDIAIKVWSSILIDLNGAENVPQIFLVLDMKNQPPNIIEKINSLKSVNWLHIYNKPINITSLIDELNEVLLKKTSPPMASNS